MANYYTDIPELKYHLNNPMTVSYTHLDVYKRQFQMLTDGKGFGIGAQFHNGSKAQIYGVEIATNGVYNFNKNTKLFYNLGYVYTEPRDADYQERNAVEATHYE